MVTVSKIATFLLLFALQASATTYFIRNGGNDSNDGLSDANAWATVSKVNSTVPSPGDTFQFKCGSTFRAGFSGNQLQTQGAGTAGNPITYTSYGTCTTPADYPRFTDSGLVTGWTSAGTNLWQKTGVDGSEGGNWFFDGLRAAWREDHHSGCPGSMTENYEVCYNSNFTTVYVRTTAGDPDNLSNPGVERLQRGNTAGLWQIDHEYIVISNLAFRRFQPVAINAEALNITIDDNVIHDNFCRCTLSASGCGSGGGQAINVTAGGTGFIRIRNNDIRRIGRDSIDTGRGFSPDGEITIIGNFFSENYNHGVLFVGINTAGGTHSGTVTVSDNEFTEVCGGIGFGCCGGASGSPGFENLIIENNYGHDWAPDDGVHSSFQRYTTLSGRQCGTKDPAIIITSNAEPVKAVIRGNRINNFGSGIRFTNGDPNSSADILHNTIYDIPGHHALHVDGGGKLTVRGNVTSASGTGSLEPFRCQSCGSDDTFEHNYFDPGSSDNDVVDWNGTNHSLSSAISSLASWDSSNIGNTFGNLPSNLFVDEANDDFTPGTGSALIDAGDTTSCSSFNGTACDIGAIESGTEPDPPEPTVDSAIIRSATPTLFEFCIATANPPALPATGCTGVTLNGTAAAPSSCARNGSNNKCMDITLDQEPGPTDTITMDYSQASGNITDSVPTELTETSGFPVINNVGDNLLDANICTSPDTFATDHELANSFDGSTSNAPGSSSGCNCDAQFVVTCNLGAAHDIGIARIFGDAGGTWYCQNYTLEHSLNGADWTTFVSTTSCFGNQWWEQDLNSLSAQYLRWTITGNITDGRTQWTELEAYGSLSSGGEEPPPPPPVLKQGRTGATEVGVKAN